MKKVLYLLFVCPIFCFGQIDIQRNASGVSLANSSSGITVVSSSYQPPISTDYTFTASTAGRFSAAVYNSDSVMVRTLFSDIAYDAGNYTLRWDGETDFPGVMAPNGDYTIRVLSSNVRYDHIGTVGNTSYTHFGSPVFSHFQGGMFGGTAVAGTDRMFWGLGYNEGGRSFTTTFTSFANSANYSSPTYDNQHSTGQGTNFLCSDGVNTYMAGPDTRPETGVSGFVVKWTTNGATQVSFSAGSSYTTGYGQFYLSVVDKQVNGNGQPTGICVQTIGNYLFVSHANQNSLRVLNKTTGALVRDITLSYPTQLAMSGDLHLWAVINGTPTRYTINADGTLTATGVTATVVSALAIGQNYDSTLMVVADGGSSQQVKGFNPTTGALLWTIGTLGGYTSDPSVSNSKFMFYDVNGAQAYVTFQLDGSFWISERGNYSNIHFSPTHTFVERTMWTGSQYQVQLDQSDSTRLFIGFQEFKVNYGGDFDTSWHLVRNWGPTLLGTAYDDVFKKLAFVSTLSNGRTYGWVYNSSTVNYYEVELPPSGHVRFTGNTMPNSAYVMERNGDLVAVAYNGVGGSLLKYRATLTGFSSNNPLRSSPAVIENVPNLGIHDVNSLGTYPGQKSSTGINVAFDPSKTSATYHIGGFKGNKWIWQSEYSTTSPNYVGEYPHDHFYDISNGVNFAGGIAIVAERHIFWNYHGEFYKAGQTNKWRHYRDDGLMIGQFGTTSYDVQQESDSMMAGNTFAGGIVKLSNGELRIYYSSEGYRGGASAIKVSGLNSVVVQSLLVRKTGNPPARVDGTDLIVPGNELSGWSATSGIVLNSGTVTAGLRDLDVRMYSIGTGKASITKDLGFNSAASDSFVLRGLIKFGNGPAPDGSDSANIDILDPNNKLIARIRQENQIDQRRSLYINGVQVLEGPEIAMKALTKYPTPFTLTVTSTAVIFRYNNGPRISTTKADGSANSLYAKTLRVLFNTPSQGYEVAFNKLNIKKQ